MSRRECDARKKRRARENSVGGQLRKAVVGIDAAADFVAEADNAGSLKEALKWAALAEQSEGAAYGHLFRAVELAYDRGVQHGRRS